LDLQTNCIKYSPERVAEDQVAREIFANVYVLKKNESFKLWIFCKEIVRYIKHPR
jgi:hypothetical protein